MPSTQHDPSHLEDIPLHSDRRSTPAAAATAATSDGNNTLTPPPPYQATENIAPPVPNVGDRAPALGREVLFPNDKPVIVVFLRHCGCP
ncbi:hypothetical protein QBC42DRAFT_292136, partial [Cladorrhinum samala]